MTLQKCESCNEPYKKKFTDEEAYNNRLKCGFCGELYSNELINERSADFVRRREVDELGCYPVAYEGEEEEIE